MANPYASTKQVPAPAEEAPKAEEAAEEAPAEEAAVEVTPAEEAATEEAPAAPAEPSDDAEAEVRHAALERGIGFEGVRPGAI